MPLAREEPEKASESSLLRDAAAQAERIALLEARHAQQVTALASKHNTETAELQARQAQEKKTAVSCMLEIHQQLTVATTLERTSLREGRESLAAEIAQMTSPGLTSGDILELNVAGKYMSTTRETLTQAEGSMLASMFGARWADRHKLDSQGRVFLNFDPYCFEKILSFLMGKLIEHPDRPAPLPVIKSEAKAQFVALVEYLGIKDCMGLADSHDADTTACADYAERFRFNQTRGMVLSQQGLEASTTSLDPQGSVCFASPAMQPGTLHYIKCTIISARSGGHCGGWLFLGITQLVAPEMDAEQHATSFGWSQDRGYAQGTSCAGPPFAPGYNNGDELIIKVDLTQDVRVMSLRSLQDPVVYKIDLHTICHSPFYFFFSAVKYNIGSGNGVAVQLSAATVEDRHLFD